MTKIDNHQLHHEQGRISLGAEATVAYLNVLAAAEQNTILALTSTNQQFETARAAEIAIGSAVATYPEIIVQDPLNTAELEQAQMLRDTRNNIRNIHGA